MTSNFVRRTLLLAVGAVVAVATLVAQELPLIAVNDNRTPAGNLRNGVLSLQLELRKGDWHPEGEKGETIPVYAFGEVGKSLQIPSPTIRVPTIKRSACLSGARLFFAFTNSLDLSFSASSTTT